MEKELSERSFDGIDLASEIGISAALPVLEERITIAATAQAAIGQAQADIQASQAAVQRLH